ncbi:MAG: FG-GAP repeat protein [Deltaproteobacteria bacterium]|nr:FG-GAP repeat protein [Deltaproteobacteria bacterium]
MLGVVVLALGVVGPALRGSAVDGVKLVAETAKTAELGDAVAVSGDLAVVGAPNDKVGDVRSGAAYVFRRLEEGPWIQTAKLAASDGSVGERFGEVVAIDGDTLVVQAGRGTVTEGVSGAAYVFEILPGETDAWQEVAKLAPSAIESGESFGQRLALEGDVVVASALEIIETEYVGTVYIFGRDEGGEGQWG